MKDGSMTKGSIPFGRRRINYRLCRTDRRKSVTIAVDPALGVLVNAPATLATDRLRAVLRGKAPWILDRLRRIEELHRPSRREFVSGESFPYLGRCYRLKVVREKTGRPRTALSGRRLRAVVGVSDGRLSTIREMLRQWYARRAARRLPERAALWAGRLGLQSPRVVVRDQAKRWGSCDRRGRILINWRIVMAPLSLVDYVVAHEVCHRVQPHHGPEFWKLLGRLMPDWESRRTRLRREGPRYFV
jgi:predicted metal-dependent hydrolase